MIRSEDFNKSVDNLIQYVLRQQLEQGYVDSSCRHGLCWPAKLLPITPMHTISVKFLNCDEL